MVARTVAQIGLLDESVPKSLKVKLNETQLLAIRNYRLEAFEVKVQRKAGYPVVQVIKCEEAVATEMTAACIERADRVKDDQQQILRKNHEIRLDSSHPEFSPSALHYILVVFAPEQDAEALVYFRYGDSVLQVPEGNSFSDFMEGNESELFMLGLHPGHKLHLALTVEQGEPRLTAPKAYSGNPKNVTLRASAGILTYDLLTDQKEASTQYGFSTTVVVQVRCPADCAYNFYYSSTDEAVVLSEGQLTSLVLSPRTRPQMSFEYFPDR